MSSNDFTLLTPSQISVNRNERQRTELRNIPDLADSIRRNGQFHPIIITRDFVLVAGERRLEACRSLGFKVACQFTDQVEEHVLHEIELEENIKREDITWQERNAAIARYHELRSANDPTWKAEKTAEAIGLDEKTVQRHIQVARAIKADPAIAQLDRLSTAVNIVARKEERARTEGMNKLFPQKKSETPHEIRNTSFLEWAPSYDGAPFNLIHCDFPYGINADKRKQGSDVEVLGGYADSEDVYWQLCEALRSNLGRLAGESAHVMFWFSMKFYRETLEFFNGAIEFDLFPLVWLKSDNMGLLPDPQRGPRRITEFALLGSIGDRKIVRAVSNAVASPTTKEIHISEKPLPVLEHFFRMLVDSSSRVLDPTCGSGTSIRAAKRLGAASALGLEINPEFAKRAGEALGKS